MIWNLGRSDKEEGEMRRYEGQGGRCDEEEGSTRSNEESGKMKRKRKKMKNENFFEDASLTTSVLFYLL